MYAQLRDLEVEAGKLDPDAPAGAFREGWLKLLTESPIARGTRLSKEYPEAVAGFKGKTEDNLIDLLTALLHTWSKVRLLRVEPRLAILLHQLRTADLTA